MSKISIVISVFESYEIVRRQLLHFSKLKGDFEVIIVDDGSRPPIEGATIRTGNNLAWTQGIGRNIGARIARGEYIFFTDIDHIITQEALDDALQYQGAKMIFRRQIGVLDENGDIRTDEKTLDDWGWTGKREASVHGNTFVIPRKVFDILGGYTKGIVGYHPRTRGGEDVHFNAKWNRYFRGIPVDVGSDIFLFPTGRFHKDGELNPKGYFHNLSQIKQETFYKYEPLDSDTSEKRNVAFKND